MVFFSFAIYAPRVLVFSFIQSSTQPSEDPGTFWTKLRIAQLDRAVDYTNYNADMASLKAKMKKASQFHFTALHL